MNRTPFAIVTLSAAALGGALLSAGVADAATAPAAAITTAAAPTTYTVVPGDTLWAIGQRFGVPMQDLAGWNGMDLSDILPVGKVLTLVAGGAASSTAAPAPSSTASAGTAPTSTASTYRSSGYRSSGYGSSTGGSATPGSSLERCVIQRESGGDAQITNGSGHWGLYQFSKGTWESYGGSSSDFGSASASEQQRVFDHAIAAGGASNWTAYDGC